MNATISPLIAQTQQANLPNAASISHVMPIGLDVGNGAVKLYSSMGQTCMESYVHYLPERATHANLGYVEYLSGEQLGTGKPIRSDLAGKVESLSPKERMRRKVARMQALMCSHSCSTLPT